MSDGVRPISPRYRKVPDRLRLRAPNERPRRFSAPCWFGCAGQPKGDRTDEERVGSTVLAVPGTAERVRSTFLD